MFLITVLLSAQVAAGILVTGATEVADPVEYSDDIEFIADVLEFGGETTTAVDLTISGIPYPMILTGSNYTLTLAASTIGIGTSTYDVTATGDAGNTNTLSSDVTVIDSVDPVINDYSIPATVCYGDMVGVFANVTDNVDSPVFYVAVNIDGADYPL